MNFNELVLAISKQYQITTIFVVHSSHISDVVLYDNAQTFFEPDVLYFVLDEAVEAGTELPLQMIVADDFCFLTPPATVLHRFPGGSC